jgi:uncharacterized phage infection (PIP) family protein YhgE
MVELIVIGSVVVVGMGAALKILWDLRGGLRRFESGLPKAADLESLRRAIAAQEQATRRLPEELSSRVADEVAAGIQPLDSSLARLSDTNEAAVDRVSQVLTGLDLDGGLGEWVANFRDTAEPFQQAAQSLEAHYETGGRLLNTTGEMVIQMAGQREALEQAFDAFSRSVVESQAAETGHLRDIEHRVMNRLEEVAEIQNLVAGALSELQTASRRTQEAHESLAESIRATVEQVHGLMDLGHRTQNQHHELIRAQEQLQERFGRWHGDLEERVQRFQTHLEQLPVRVGQALQETTQKTVAEVQSLGQKLAAFHDRQRQTLEGLVEHQRSVAEAQNRLVEAQQRQATRAPSRSLQVATLVALALQAVLLGVIAVGVLG